jgi:hypothetical protein
MRIMAATSFKNIGHLPEKRSAAVISLGEMCRPFFWKKKCGCRDFHHSFSFGVERPFLSKKRDFI